MQVGCKWDEERDKKESSRWTCSSSVDIYVQDHQRPRTIPVSSLPRVPPTRGYMQHLQAIGYQPHDASQVAGIHVIATRNMALATRCASYVRIGKMKTPSPGVAIKEAAPGRTKKQDDHPRGVVSHSQPSRWRMGFCFLGASQWPSRDACIRRLGRPGFGRN